MYLHDQRFSNLSPILSGPICSEKLEFGGVDPRSWKSMGSIQIPCNFNSDSRAMVDFLL